MPNLEVICSQNWVLNIYIWKRIYIIYIYINLASLLWGFVVSASQLLGLGVEHHTQMALL